MEDMQKEKEKILLQKRTMGNNLAERKKLLMDKVSNILTTGHFKTKEDIYRKVFNEDELQTLGFSMNKTISSNNTSRMKRNSKFIKTEANDEEKNNKNEDGFFLTQGNNETNTKEERKNDFDNEGENSANNENSGNEIKEDGNDNEQNKEYNDEFES